ncbi:hypothetical protein [Dyella sp. 333MFSha]|uniref:hypothetical protein n=1 Tax=Dyella sp. 333MFSha TaxID=1798240 RepID=UPI000890E7A0|nr:hypothetical protein [Dyella sp. 333MFSha]SDF38111.1 hypothetical protein SAMN04515659_0814 [Dyella sp. 333MFSha]
MSVIKHVLAAAAALAVSGCGGKSMIESDMSRLVSASPASPWLTVENRGESVVVVSGLEGKPKVQVSPDIATAVEARLRTTLQPKYITDLIINCRGLETATSVAAEAEPPAASLTLAVNCRIVNRGVVTAKAYRIQQSLPVQPDAPRLDTLVPRLIDGASTQLADQLWADVKATTR